MEKSSDAFRTISEVAEDLALPQHVLRFWETKFAHIRPLKRAGGRRYYRPADVILLRTIRQLLYDEGYTIKGVQKLLKEQGARSFRAGIVPTAELPDLEVESKVDPDLDTPPPAATTMPTLSPAPVAPAETAWHAPPPRTERAELLDLLSIIDDCARILDGLRPRSR